MGSVTRGTMRGGPSKRKAQVVIFNSFSMLLALIWTIQLVRTIHAEAESVNLAAAEDTGYLATINPFQYEEGRETFGVLISVAWLKMTSHVSRSQFRSGRSLPAPRRLVMTSLYLSITPLLLTLVCILRCQTNTDSCLAVMGL